MQVPNVLEIVPNYNGLPSIRINDIVGILAWRDADTLDDIKKIYRQIKRKTREIKTGKIFRAKYRNELDDDLEEHVEKKFKPVVTFFYHFSPAWR